MRRFGTRLLVIAAMLAAWQLVSWLGLVSPIILASPMAIAKAAASAGPVFLAAFQFTLVEIVVAVAVTWVLGIGTGALLGAWPTLALATGPLLSSAFAIPFVVWYPILMLWLGLGAESKITYGVLVGFFPIAINTLNAVHHLDRRYITLARSLGAGSGQLFWKFILPLTLPSVVSGLRVGTSFAVIGVLVAEMLASTEGLGFWISYHRTLYDTGHVYLGIALALACTVLVNSGLTLVERRVGRWKDSETLQR
jgi:NitT/TauT family transport system permease protein